MLKRVPPHTALQTPAAKYGVAVAASVLAVGMRALVNPVLGDQSRYAFLLPAILIVAVYGGVGPATVTLLLGCALTVLFIVPPWNTFQMFRSSDVGGLVVFLAIGAGMLFLTHREVKERRRREETERRLEDLNARLEKTVEERTSDLRRANRELESFCYSMAHDLRTPTRAIAGNARILIEDHGDGLKPELRGHLGRINAAALKLGNLVDSLLTYARLATQELHPKTIDLSRVVAEIVQSESRRMRVDAGLEIEPEMFVFGDERQFRTMVQAIIHNSLLYRKPGESACLRVRSMPSGFEFADDGIGFDMAYAHKVFLPFERLHRDDAYPGVGMGLANVERIVQRHGGSASVDALPGVGTTIRLCLPASAMVGLSPERELVAS